MTVSFMSFIKMLNSRGLRRLKRYRLQYCLPLKNFLWIRGSCVKTEGQCNILPIQKFVRNRVSTGSYFEKHTEAYLKVFQQSDKDGPLHPHVHTGAIFQLQNDKAPPVAVTISEFKYNRYILHRQLCLAYLHLRFLQHASMKK